MPTDALLSSSLAVHGVCICLVLVNYVVRIWRTQVIFSALSEPVPFADVGAANLAGDTAAALTPLRFGGIPAQVAFFQRVGPTPSTTVPVLLVESMLLYPVYAVVGGALALSAGLEWFGLLKTAEETARGFAQIVMALFVLGWLLILLARRAAPTRSKMIGRSMREGFALIKRMNAPAVLLTIPLTMVDVLTRIALLPVLASSIAGAPPADVLAIASFAMLYGQIAMPTPGGAGIVDLGLIGGAAGDLGSGAGGVVFWWRAYTVGVHMLCALPMLWWRLRTDRAPRSTAVR